jgi:hypothetical protein
MYCKAPSTNVGHTRAATTGDKWATVLCQEVRADL